MEKLDGKSMDIVKANIEALKQLFPEVVTEGKIDFEKLKLILGEEIEARNEKYEFTWHGKTQAMKLAQTPSTGTLRPDKASSKNWDTTENLYIEGDNLEVLKLLQKSYFGKIKMIYIDPPYNTGKDFVYKDDFRDNIKNYKEITQQTTKANTETNGRFHTDWLNMIYPRLKLARNLLKEDGLILVSINDKELANLLMVMNEIFGEENHLATFVWKSRRKPINVGDSKFKPQRCAEYVLMYAKNSNNVSFNPLYSGETRSYPYEDQKGKYRLTTILKSNRGTNQRSTMRFEVGGYTPPPDQRWQGGEDFIKDLFNNGYIEFKNGIPFRKYYEHEEEPENDPFYTFMDPEITGSSESGKTELNTLIGNYHGFDTVKPKEIIEIFIRAISSGDDIILDFFSGSATTAHAVMQLNAEDGGNRKFIMVQLPEKTDEKSEAYKAGYENICEIGKERIRRAGEKIVQETGKTDLDIGFKVFKLDSSNVKTWDPDFDNLEQTLFDLQDNIKEDRTKEDLLYEILLKIGLPLTIPIEEIDYNGKTIYNVAYGSVLVCLEDDIDLDIVQEMLKYQSEHMPPKVIFKESGFISDAVKTNAIQTLKKHGITDVRSV
ncbi:site-specific DNA-methyltransferase [Geobacillus stearothermophilus]|uniref:site-specific DNA-methyltransferase n=1 Tax=Geobacillus stearothermophilus TaxID=1422 RepID=UPI003D1A6F4B